MGGADIGADDALEMDLHRPFAESLGKACGGLDDQALVHVADAVAVENGGREAFGDPERLGFIGACQADHFDGGALAELEDAGGLTGLGCGLCHDDFLLGFPEAVRPPWPICPSVRSRGAGASRAFQGPGRPAGAEQSSGQAGLSDLRSTRACSATSGMTGRPAARQRP